MRKQYKQKKKSCAMCKPHKMGWSNRWKKKEQEQMEIDEEEILRCKYGVDDANLEK